MDYMDGAHPFFHRGNNVGCLVVHGFTATPAEVRWLGAHLAQDGMTVYGVRLAGHGMSYRDMRRARWRDWYASVMDGYHVLRQQCDQIVVIGHSMGGLLSLLLASDDRTHVEAVAVLASPILFPKRLIRTAKTFKWVRPYTDHPYDKQLLEIIRAEQSTRGEPVLGTVRYDRWSTAAVDTFFDLVQVVETRLPRVSAPLLLLYAEHDTTAPPVNVEHIAGRVSSKTVEKHVLLTGGHIVTQDVERDQTFALVSDFARRHTSR